METKGPHMPGDSPLLTPPTRSLQAQATRRFSGAIQLAGVHAPDRDLFSVFDREPEMPHEPTPAPPKEVTPDDPRFL